MSTHDELRQSLGAYVLGQLKDTDLHAEVEEHVRTCEQCRAERDELGPIAAALRTVQADELRPVGIVPPPELDRRILDALPPTRPDRQAGRRRATVLSPRGVHRRCGRDGGRRRPAR